MTKRLLSLLLSAACLSAISQQLSSANVPGKWVLSKHLITVKGKLVDKMDPKRISSYFFSRDGTYRLTEGESGNTRVYVTKGRWKVSANGGKIHLYGNVDVPNDPVVEIGDSDLAVVYLDGAYYLTDTYGDTLFPPNTDYWKKIN